MKLKSTFFTYCSLFTLIPLLLLTGCDNDVIATMEKVQVAVVVVDLDNIVGEGATITLTVETPDRRSKAVEKPVALDSEPATIYLDPGTWSFSVEAKSGDRVQATVSEVITLRRGEKTTVRLGLRSIYNILFDYNGGADPSVLGKRVVPGDAYGELPTPTRDGHTFTGWFTDPTVGDAVTAEDLLTIATLHTLYAHWSVNQYTITFDSDGGSPVAALTQDWGTSIYPPAEPTKGGYTFSAWSPVLPPSMPAENHTHTAIWRANTDTGYTVEHYLQDVSGSGYTLQDTENLTGETGETVSAADKNYTGFAENLTHPNSHITAPIAADGSLILCRYYDRNLFTVSFNANGGAAISDITDVRWEAAIDKPADPTRTGYSFLGWYQDASLTNPWDFASDTVTEATTLYATWSVNEYTITFDSNGGSPVAAITQDYGTAVTTPANPTRTGYTFSKWDPALPSTMPAENRTHTAIWNANINTAYTVEHYLQDVSGSGYALQETESLTGTTGSTANATVKSYTGFVENTGHDSRIASGQIAGDGSLLLRRYYDRILFTVSFNANGGTAVSPITDVRYEATTGAPAAPTKTGYSFGGWYKEDTKINAWDFTSDIVTAATTLYAKWNPNTNTPYTVEHYQQNVSGSGYTWKEKDTLTGTTGATVTAEPKSYPGFTVNGIASGEIDRNGRLLLQLFYDRDLFTVSFNSQGGSEVSGITDVRFGAPISAPAAPTKTGYSFGGWYKDEALSDAWNFTSDKVFAETTLHAKWDSITYTVTFDGNEGTATPSSKTVILNETYGTLATAIRAGYALEGWYTAKTGGTKIESTTTVTLTADQTLYARWTPVVYDITYHLDGGINNVDNPATYTIESAAITLQDPTKTGYVFAGWYDALSGGNQVTGIAAGSLGTKTLHARWKATYAVTYDGNGATGGTPPAAQTKTEGIALTLQSNGGSLAKTGYVFDGWNTAANGSGTSYAAGSEYTGNAAIKLYAQWAYAIGNTGPAGGWIIYDKGNSSDGWRYLEAAPSDAIKTSPAQSEYLWKQDGRVNKDNTGTEIGDGYTNNGILVGLTMSGNGPNYPAAEAARQYSHNGFTDWYLPSLGELGLMYTVLMKNKKGAFTDDFYWSSSNGSASSEAYAASFLDYGDFYPASSDKGSPSRVRPVRRF